MTSKETFTHYQPQGNSDPAHTATAPGGLSAKAPAMTPLMLDTSIRALATQLPAFRQKLSDGWYQVRIAGQDVSTSGLTLLQVQHLENITLLLLCVLLAQ